MTIHLYKGDLPTGLDLGKVVAMDTETLGLTLGRDRLCVVQLSSGDGHSHLVQMPKPGPDGQLAAPNLVKLLTDPSITKLLHFARFDLAVLQRTFGVITAPVYCTKVASRLVRTYTDRHGLKDLVKELLNIELSKQQQSSDWGADELTPEQQAYAGSDVLHLHALKARLDMMLARENRTELAAACFAFLPVRAALDLGGWPDDIFAH
jgi:ribonuclease D